MLRDGHLHVSLGENGDDVARLQRQVLHRLALNGLAQIEWQQVGRKIIQVHALNHRVLPVDLCSRSLDLVLELFLLDGLGLGLSHSLRQRFIS